MRPKTNKQKQKSQVPQEKPRRPSELGLGEEDLARMRKGQTRYWEQVQKAQDLNLCSGGEASGVTRGSMKGQRVHTFISTKILYNI